jgi:amino acid transporter
MRSLIKHLLFYTIVGICITYVFGWMDLAGNKQLSGNIFRDIYHSITYYFGWVLIYWWLNIIIFALVLAILTSTLTYVWKWVKHHTPY